MSHNPETCKDCLKKEKNTLKEYEKIMNLSGTIEDFETKKQKMKW